MEQVHIWHERIYVFIQHGLCTSTPACSQAPPSTRRIWPPCVLLYLGAPSRPRTFGACSRGSFTSEVIPKAVKKKSCFCNLMIDLIHSFPTIQPFTAELPWHQSHLPWDGHQTLPQRFWLACQLDPNAHELERAVPLYTFLGVFW